MEGSWLTRPLFAVGFYDIGIQIGTLVGFWINYGMGQKYVQAFAIQLGAKTDPVRLRSVAPGKFQWQFPIIVQLFPAALLGIGMFFVPETPRFLMMQGVSRVGPAATESKLTLSAFCRNTTRLSAFSSVCASFPSSTSTFSGSLSRLAPRSRPRTSSAATTLFGMSLRLYVGIPSAFLEFVS